MKKLTGMKSELLSKKREAEKVRGKITAAQKFKKAWGWGGKKNEAQMAEKRTNPRVCRGSFRQRGGQENHQGKKEKSKTALKDKRCREKRMVRTLREEPGTSRPWTWEVIPGKGRNCLQTYVVWNGSPQRTMRPKKEATRSGVEQWA